MKSTTHPYRVQVNGQPFPLDFPFGGGLWSSVPFRYSGAMFCSHVLHRIDSATRGRFAPMVPSSSGYITVYPPRTADA